MAKRIKAPGKSERTGISLVRLFLVCDRNGPAPFLPGGLCYGYGAVR